MNKTAKVDNGKAWFCQLSAYQILGVDALPRPLRRTISFVRTGGCQEWKIGCQAVTDSGTIYISSGMMGPFTGRVPPNTEPAPKFLTQHPQSLLGCSHAAVSN